ncbi:MAG: Wadjet anti-phage system protein JetD domain-containing protein [Rhodospirillaceae bacterium]
MTPHPWTTPADIRSHLQKQWDQGRVLRSLLGGEPLFPLTLTLRRPDSRTMLNNFAAVRAWAEGLEAGSRAGAYRVVHETINHRQLGVNRVPQSVVIYRPEDALRILGRQSDADIVVRLAAVTLAAFPTLQDWLLRRPLTLLEHAEDWPRVLAVLEWFRTHPQSQVYMRQVDAPGVDTKFIESRRGLLMGLLDIVLPAEAIDPTATRATGFEQRYGLVREPVLVRFRFLDPALRTMLPIGAISDFSVPAEEFARLSLPVRRVVITENKTNGLAFPDMAASMVIFGLGYGLDRLADCQWLHTVEVLYWGDIDTHGFAILDRLRRKLPHSQSFLMDRLTLLKHEAHWAQEKEPCSQELFHLTDAEQALYDDLQSNRLGERVRLEQERVRFRHVHAEMLRLDDVNTRASHTSPR